MKRRKIKEIFDMIAESPNENIRFELLELFFTPNELEQLSARFEIIKGLIRAEKTQREIAEDLQLSIAKITRGSNELKRRSESLHAYLNKTMNKRKK